MTNQVSESVKSVIDRSMSNLQIDKNIIATIRSYNENTKEYDVYTDTISFIAKASNDVKYLVGSQVVVLVPNNDYANNCVIIAKYTDDERAIIYGNPKDNYFEVWAQEFKNGVANLTNSYTLQKKTKKPYSYYSLRCNIDNPEGIENFNIILILKWNIQYGDKTAEYLENLNFSSLEMGGNPRYYTGAFTQEKYFSIPSAAALASAAELDLENNEPAAALIEAKIEIQDFEGNSITLGLGKPQLSFGYKNTDFDSDVGYIIDQGDYYKLLWIHKNKDNTVELMNKNSKELENYTILSKIFVRTSNDNDWESRLITKFDDKKVYKDKLLQLQNNEKLGASVNIIEGTSFFTVSKRTEDDSLRGYSFIVQKNSDGSQLFETDRLYDNPPSVFFSVEDEDYDEVYYAYRYDKKNHKSNIINPDMATKKRYLRVNLEDLTDLTYVDIYTGENNFWIDTDWTSIKDIEYSLVSYSQFQPLIKDNETAKEMYSSYLAYYSQKTLETEIKKLNQYLEESEKGIAANSEEEKNKINSYYSTKAQYYEDLQKVLNDYTTDTLDSAEMLDPKVKRLRIDLKSFTQRYFDIEYTLKSTVDGIDIESNRVPEIFTLVYTNSKEKSTVEHLPLYASGYTEESHTLKEDTTKRSTWDGIVDTYYYNLRKRGTEGDSGDENVENNAPFLSLFLTKPSVTIKNCFYGLGKYINTSAISSLSSTIHENVEMEIEATIGIKNDLEEDLNKWKKELDTHIKDYEKQEKRYNNLKSSNEISEKNKEQIKTCLDIMDYDAREIVVSQKEIIDISNLILKYSQDIKNLQASIGLGISDIKTIETIDNAFLAAAALEGSDEIKVTIRPNVGVITTEHPINFTIFELSCSGKSRSTKKDIAKKVYIPFGVQYVDNLLYYQNRKDDIEDLRFKGQTVFIQKTDKLQNESFVNVKDGYPLTLQKRENGKWVELPESTTIDGKTYYLRWHIAFYNRNFESWDDIYKPLKIKDNTNIIINATSDILTPKDYSASLIACWSIDDKLDTKKLETFLMNNNNYNSKDIIPIWSQPFGIIPKETEEKEDETQ